MTRGVNKLRSKPPVSLDKHDILYTRARYFLHQRHVKRPWFNLNPFLERTDEQIDLEEFVPDESKYIQKLESLVMCECYSCDYPKDTKELTIGMFFPYLYSNAWDDGISVRILEGQLFDQLMLSLYKLEREGTIVRHKTYAFARNQRPITGCYKLADKETYGHIDEQLLLEFTYFGDLEKLEPNVQTTNPLDYLEKYRLGPEIPGVDTEPSTIELPPISGPSAGPARRKTRAASISVDASKQKYSFDPGLSTDTKRRGSLFAKPLNAIRALNAMQLPQSDRRQSLPAAAGPVPFTKMFAPTPAPLPGGDRRRWSEPVQKTTQRRRISVAGNDMSGFQIPKALQKLLDEAKEFETLQELDESTKKSIKTKKCKIKSESFEQLVVEDDPYYGEELYLTDQNQTTAKKPLKAKQLLQKKKLELQQRRKEKQKVIDAMAEKKLEIEERSKMDSTSDIGEKKLHYSLNWPDKCPSFEEFIRLCQEEEYVDPRIKKKAKQRTRRAAKRYNLEKEAAKLASKITVSTVEVDSSSSQRIAATSSIKLDSNQRLGSCQRLTTLPISKQDSSQRLATSSGKLDGGQRYSISSGKPEGGWARRSSTMIGAGGRGTVGLRLPPVQELNVTPDNKESFAGHVYGITGSEPCKEHCLKVLTDYQREKEEKEKRESEREKMKQKRKDGGGLQPDVLLKSTSGPVHTDHLSPTPSRSSSPQMFPRVSMGEEVVESPVLYSDDYDESDEDTSSFDSTKLKLNYSIERLRKKRKKAKKRPAFVEILKKYYRAQAALQAFRKNSIGSEMRATKERARKFSISKYLKKPKEEPRHSTPPMVIGKLKNFKFLDIKSQKPKQVRLDQIQKADFSTYDIEEFEKELEKSLKDFVVRREIVASDLNNRCATSLTFTRRQSFKAKQ